MGNKSSIEIKDNGLMGNNHPMLTAKQLKIYLSKLKYNKLCKHGTECTIFKKCLNYCYTEEHITHLSNFSHGIHECKYNLNCWNYNRLKNGKLFTEDIIHSLLYTHKNIHGQVNPADLSVIQNESVLKDYVYINVSNHVDLSTSFNKLNNPDKDKKKIKIQKNDGKNYQIANSLSIFRCNGHCGNDIATLFWKYQFPRIIFWEWLNVKSKNLYENIFNNFDSKKLNYLVLNLIKKTYKFIHKIIGILHPIFGHQILRKSISNYKKIVENIKKWFDTTLDEYTLNKTGCNEFRIKCKTIINSDGEIMLLYSLLDRIFVDNVLSNYFGFISIYIVAICNNYVKFLELTCNMNYDRNYDVLNEIKRNIKDPNVLSNINKIKDKEITKIFNTEYHKSLHYPLNETELLALKLYTDNKTICTDLQNCLRNKNYCRWKNLQYNMTQGITKLYYASKFFKHLSGPKQLFRGLYNVDFSKRIDQWVTSLNFMSTTTDLNVSKAYGDADNVGGCILCLKNINTAIYADISWISVHKDEKEYLFVPCMLKSKKIKRDNNIQYVDIRLEEVILYPDNKKDIYKSILTNRDQNFCNLWKAKLTKHPFVFDEGIVFDPKYTSKIKFNELITHPVVLMMR